MEKKEPLPVSPIFRFPVSNKICFRSSFCVYFARTSSNIRAFFKVFHSLQLVTGTDDPSLDITGISCITDLVGIVVRYTYTLPNNTHVLEKYNDVYVIWNTISYAQKKRVLSRGLPPYCFLGEGSQGIGTLDIIIPVLSDSVRTYLHQCTPMAVIDLVSELYLDYNTFAPTKSQT